MFWQSEQFECRRSSSRNERPTTKVSCLKRREMPNGTFRVARTTQTVQPAERRLSGVTQSPSQSTNITVRPYWKGSGGLHVDVTVRLANGLMHRERGRLATASKSAALHWGQDRERFLLQHGLPPAKKEVPTFEEFWPRFLNRHVMQGLRRGEIAALQWADVDFQKRQLSVRRSVWQGNIGSTKGGRLRHVPLTARLAAALQSARHLRGPWKLGR
jgi:hypothetical protein